MGLRKIIFRADGGPTIGMGHFIRTLALAEMLKDDFFCVYATQSPMEYQINEIESVCLKRFDLPSDDTHYDIFLSLLKGNEIVVLDNYYFSTDYQRAIKAKGCKLVCIDDTHEKEFFADLIINHAPGINPNNYIAQTYTKYALGLEYALLRSTFLNQVKEERRISSLETILICFGGSDPLNLTKSVLEIVLKFEKFKKIIVITGAAYQSVSTLSELILKDERIEHLHSVNQLQMLQTMLQADLAIVPTSGMLFELMSVGVAAITGYFAKNQQEASYSFGKLNLAFDLGNLMDNLNEKLHNQIDLISVDCAQKVVDNQKCMLKNSKDLHINNFNRLY